MPANITHQNGATEKRWAPIMVFSGISGLGRTTIYQLLAAKILRGKKVYGRTLIDVPHGLAAIEAIPDASITLPNSRRGARGRPRPRHRRKHSAPSPPDRGAGASPCPCTWKCTADSTAKPAIATRPAREKGPIMSNPSPASVFCPRCGAVPLEADTRVLPRLARVILATSVTAACDRIWLQHRLDRNDWINSDVRRVRELLSAAE